MLDSVYQKSQSIMYIGDKENSNADSALVSTKRSLIFNQLNKELYQKFFMNTEELQACRDGYIYVHDMSARRDTMNCCLFDVGTVLKGGFEMGNLWYNEPKTLNVAFDVIGDIVLSAASQQYGGFTVPSVDLLLEPYAERSYKMLTEKYTRLGLDADTVEKEVMADILNDFEQGFQGWEYKFNTVASSRGDYPFITMTMGTGTGRFAKMATITMLNVRSKGQGKKGHKKPVLFPKIVFLYDENLHGPGKPLEDVFEAGILCSSRAMYPDWLSLTGEGYVPSMYKKVRRDCQPDGLPRIPLPVVRARRHEACGRERQAGICRPLEHWCGIAAPADDLRQGSAGEPSVPRGAGLLSGAYPQATYPHLCVPGGDACIYQSAGVLRGGGFYGGHLKPSDKIKPIMKTATASFGITALNELQELYNGKSLAEDGQFALETLQYINDKVERSRTRTAICMLSTVHRQRVCAVCRSSSSARNTASSRVFPIVRMSPTASTATLPRT